MRTAGRLPVQVFRAEFHQPRDGRPRRTPSRADDARRRLRGVFLQYAHLIDTDGKSYNLNGLPGQANYFAIDAEISEDGEVIGSAEDPNSPAGSEKAFSFSGGTLTLGPQSEFLQRQGGGFLFQAADGKQFLWSPATGSKPTPVPPIRGALLAIQNRVGQWLISKDGGTATRLLTPK